MAVVGDVRHADQVRRGLSDGPGFRRPPAVQRVAAERGPELLHTRGRAVRVPVPGRSFLRQRTVPGHGGRPADQPGRQLRVPGRRRRVQRPAVRGPAAVLRQGKVQRMIKTHPPPSPNYHYVGRLRFGLYPKRQIRLA